jgi:hypothetical protein
VCTEDFGPGVVDLEGMADIVDVVNTVETVHPEIATKVSAPIATLTPIQQLQAESPKASRREDTLGMMRRFASSEGSQAM